MATFLITGGAGFIGSNLAHALASQGETVRILDDFSTGRRANLSGLGSAVEVIEGSVCDRAALEKALRGVRYCLHQAAIPAVPRSIAAPEATNHANVDGTLSVFVAARAAGVERVVYASSSSVYGNAQTFPLNETLPKAPISPYAVSKAAGEMYAEVFSELYGMDLVGLRYFNVFGPRQDPNSDYAAVIPRFVVRLLRGEAPIIFGDGTQARDFTFVDNVVDANLRACRRSGPLSGVYNIACGRPVSVLELARALSRLIGADIAPEFHPARAGEILRSWADISRARGAFAYEPSVSLEEGLTHTLRWLREEEGTSWRG